MHRNTGESHRADVTRPNHVTRCVVIGVALLIALTQSIAGWAPSGVQAATTAHCYGLVATIVGTADADTLYGTSGADVIVGLGGSDFIAGGRGNDTICGGPGADGILGAPGDDHLAGGDGSDVILGQSGNDYLRGFSGDDTVDGGLGNDSVEGGDGHDHARNWGNDTLRGRKGRDVMAGSAGTDLLIDEDPDGMIDRMYGFAGDDRLLGRDGTNHEVLAGGAGDLDLCFGDPFGPDSTLRADSAAPTTDPPTPGGARFVA